MKKYKSKEINFFNEYKCFCKPVMKKQVFFSATSLSFVSRIALLFCCIGLMFLIQNCSQVNRIDRHTPFGYPYDGEIVTKFGNRIHPVFGTPDFHTGIDIPAPEGADLKATADGNVEESGYFAGYGYRVIINHGNNLKTLYAHCSELLVKIGEEVKRGQVIAKAGSTGTATKSHVHYEIIQDGKQIDPEEFNNNILNKNKG